MEVKTYTLYDKDTGEFGPIISGTEEDLFIYRAAHKIPGAHKGRTHKIDLVTRSIVSKDPRKPLLKELKDKRNALLDGYRWTVAPDSPLKASSKNDWLLWLKSLNGLLKNVTDETTDTVVWPEMPALDYG